MLDNNIIQSTSSWPFVEIRKLLKDRKNLIKAKNKITGYASVVQSYGHRTRQDRSTKRRFFSVA